MAEKIPVQVDVALVDAADPGETVQVESMHQQDAGVAREIEGFELSCQQLMLDGAAGEAFHAVQPRAHHEHRLRITRADLGDVDRELFPMRSSRADRIAQKHCPATLGGAQKPLARGGIRGREMVNRIDAHEGGAVSHQSNSPYKRRGLCYAGDASRRWCRLAIATIRRRDASLRWNTQVGR